MPLEKLKKIMLFGGDILALYLGLYLTLLLRLQTVPSAAVWDIHFLPFSLLFLIWILVFYINGLYDLAASKNDIEFYNKILQNLFLNFTLGAGYFYFLTDKLFDIKPRAVYFIFIGVTLVLWSLWRYCYNTLVQKPTLLKNVLVIGMKDEARELIKEIMRKPQLGYRIAAIVSDGLPPNQDFPEVTVFPAGSDIKAILKQHHISAVVSSLPPHSDPKLIQSLYESLSLKLQFFDLPNFYEKLTGKIPVTTIGHIWFLQNLALGDNTFYEYLKRLLDICASILGIILSVPLMPLIVLAITLDNPRGPIFFRQMRVGLLNKPFRAVKFRSMIEGAEKEGEPQWAQKNDPRVTKIGRFLRKTRLDEIPQLLNVLKGEMSLIGPRPERPEFVKRLAELIPFYNERHLVKPGLTGWAQINFQYGASAGDALKKLQYDLFYVKNRSIPLDIGIMLKTINIILTGRGQ